MTVEFKLPLISEGVEAADIAAVHVHEGDVVEAGQIVLEVETEKAVAEIPSPQAGRIEKILVKQGQTVKIGEVLLTIEESADSKTEAKTPAAPAPAAKKETQEKPARPPVSPPQNEEPVRQETKPASAELKSEPAAPVRSQPAAPAERGQQARARQRPWSPRGPMSTTMETWEPPVPAGPATRRLARELGVDLHRVSGSGPGGRITSDDVQSFVRSLTTSRSPDPSGPMGALALPPFDRFGPIERRPMNKLARVSAANLTAAWQTIPHVTQHELADVTELEEARQGYVKTIGQHGPKVTMTAIMVKAVVVRSRRFPRSIPVSTWALASW